MPASEFALKSGSENVLAAARRIADDVLFPRALATDAAAVVPPDLLDVLASEGFYGLSAPRAVGGLDIDHRTYCAVVEALSSGCLTTAFVWVQHHGAVRGVANSANPAIRERWLAPLARGTVRAGLAGAAGAPLRARQVEGGWLFSGTALWVSGWGVIHVMHAAACVDDNHVVWGLIDPVEDDHLQVSRLYLAALNASATVTVELRDYFVADERVTGIVPPRGPADDFGALRVHAAFALGTISRCCALIGASPLDAALADCRAALDAATWDTMPAARAAAAELAHRAAGLLMVTTGSRAVLLDNHAQRLAREALFMLVYALRPPVKAALLEQLAGSDRRAVRPTVAAR